MSLGFVKGKVYKTTVEDFYPDCGLTHIGQEFVCSHVDADGDCWSTSLLCKGEEPYDDEGWCVAEPEQLRSGKVVEVTEEGNQ